MADPRFERLRELNAAFNGGGDWIRFYDPEIEFAMPPDWPEQAVFRGHAGLREVLRLWRENFDEYHWDEHELVAGPDCVVGLYRHRGRVKGGETWIDQPIGCVFRFRGELIVDVRSFSSWAETFAAAGIEPPAETAAGAE